MTGPAKGRKGFSTSTIKLKGPTPIVTTANITLSWYPHWGPLATTGNNKMDPSWIFPIKVDCSLL
jgi:hypothetical protein